MMLVGGPIKEVPTEACRLRCGDRITLSTPGGAILTVNNTAEFGSFCAVRVNEFDHPFLIVANATISVWVDA